MSAPDNTVDTLLHPDWLVPVVPRGVVLDGHSLAITGGRISHILPRNLAAGLQAKEELALPGRALMPGLVNLHGHAAMSLLRGYADDLPLMPWLEQHIWPAEGQHVSAEFVRDGTELAIAEMLRSGTTTFSDMYFFPDAAAAVAIDSGIRCQLVFPVLDFPTAWARDADDYISKGLRLRDDVKHQQLVTIGFGPHAPYTVSRPNLQKVATLAAELDVPVQIHLHETRGEVLAAVEENGERPLDTLNAIGLLGPRTQCVHMTDLGEQDMALLAATGAHVVHCPQSNMKLASGACPTAKLLARGVNVALGTDGAASNNSLNMFMEMRAAALLGKVTAADAAALPAEDSLYMATMGGARAMGLADDIGSLEVGKQADLIAVDLSGPECQPLYKPLSQLVYAGNGSQVSHSWVAGHILVRDGNLTRINITDLLSRCSQWQQTINSEQI
ncbi:TRZ/ATZ family hydrolase [Seongchinamella sediminis]|uniref:5-methylthioadenosine/S-adenosylhomocysteine deaminase n=1 Tax=Seongchinamella sediminis TaxID=2283635 RepID=A0A3L7E162_9GAMM|nr:TRZ/ATZ family hydrolase [Seongchinamella sediminis]RLQ22689.1 TRZ/ATZ family hydrolase [Seongchinamella sediminis]